MVDSSIRLEIQLECWDNITIKWCGQILKQMLIVKSRIWKVAKS